MSNIEYRKTLETTLDQIAQARAIWEEGTLKSANEELYAILECCFAVFAEMKDDTAKRRARHVPSRAMVRLSRRRLSALLLVTT